MVGRPCGQFHGASNVVKFCKIFFILARVKGVPIIMDDRQARMASMFRTLLGRTMVLLAEFNPTESWERTGTAYSPSSSIATSSWTSEASKTVSLLNGTAASAKREAVGVLFFSSSPGDTATSQKPNPFIKNVFSLDLAICSSAGESSSRCG